MSKVRTLRGTFTASTTGNYEAHRILLDDGDPTTAYRIKEFYAWSVDGVSSADGCMVLATEEGGITSYAIGTQNAGDNRQIGWAAWFNVGSSGDREIGQGLVDQDNVVNEHLYLGAFNSSTGSDDVNYYTVAEKIKINLTQNLYATVRNMSQG